MNRKYLFAALALPLMFSCTQDEFAVQGTDSANNALQNRIKVGKVAFTNAEDKADTRFDFAEASWEEGDMFRLFLMDDWANGSSCGWGGQEYGEENDANKTHFMEQQVWNNMYKISNRMWTNVPFRYDAQSKQWTNDDAIVEGNYFAVSPATGGKQKDILNDVRNRRDVWVYINPVQKFNELNVNSVSFEGVEENQFFLGYTQIYRNEEATKDNELQLPIQMRPIMANIDLRIINADEKTFRVEKMVISRKDGQPMPTLAYVRPCDNTPEDFNFRQDDGEGYFNQQWAKVATPANIADFRERYPELCQEHSLSTEAGWQEKGTFVNVGPAFAQPYIMDKLIDECGVITREYYWSPASWTRSAARSVVEYAYPGEKGFTPYAGDYDDLIADPAYEYVIDFTNAENPEGIELGTLDYIRPFITLPHNMLMNEYVFTVYGQQKDIVDGTWSECILKPRSAKINDAATSTLVEEDGRFTLADLDPSLETSYIKATIEFDDFYPITSRIVQTTNSADLLNRLEAYYGKMEEGFPLTNTRNEYFYVRTLGDFVVTNDLVDYVQELNNRYGVSEGGKALVYFTETKSVDGSGRIIFPADLKNDHAIDLFYYSKKAEILNKGTQIIEKPIIYDYDKTEEEFFKALRATNWWNAEGDGIDVYHKIEPALANKLYGGIGSITNEGTLTLKEVIVEAGMIGDAIYNAEGAKLTIKSSGIVGGENLEDEIRVHNDGEIVLVKSFIQGTLNNSGKVDVKDGGSEISSELNNSNICNGCPTGPAVVTIWENATLDCPNVVNGQKGEGEIIIKDGGVAYISGTNYDTITVYGELIPAAEESTLENAEEGVIYVSDGEFKFVTGSYTSGKIMNEGTIYAIGESHVHINGGKGIIDVTLVKEGGWQAASNSIDTYFRYCNVATDNVLKERISDNNISSWQNPIILQYPSFTVDADATKNEQTLSIAYEEKKSYEQNEVTLPVRKILVAEDATLNLEGTWELLNPFTPGLGNAYQALQVTPKANLIVNNNKVLTIKPYTEDTHVVIDGKMAVKNQAKLLNGGKDQLYEVIVDGAGIFEFAGNAVDNEWTKGNIATWTNTSF